MCDDCRAKEIHALTVFAVQNGMEAVMSSGMGSMLLGQKWHSIILPH